MTAARIPPATPAPAIQRVFWTGPDSTDASVVGDWQNFRDLYDDFPKVPSQDFVGSAISAVLAGKLGVAAALTQAERQMNAELLT